MAKALSSYIKYIIGALVLIVIIGVVFFGSALRGNSSDITFSSNSQQTFSDLGLPFQNDKSCGYFSCAVESDFVSGSVINGYVVGILDYETIVFQAVDGNQYAVKLAGVILDISKSSELVNTLQVLFGANNKISIMLDGPVINESSEYVGWVKLKNDNNEEFLIQTALNDIGLVISPDASESWSLSY